MKYHKNARTNEHLRKLIQKSPDSVRSIAERLGISKTTVQKWRKAKDLVDRSSRPTVTHKALTKVEERIVVSVRKHLKMPLDDLLTTLSRYLPKLNRTNCYRTLRAYGLAVLPKPFQKRGRFGKYPPGFLHLDLAYLPFLGARTTRLYLFVAIDRITKLVFLAISPGKHQIWAIKFLQVVVAFFPYRIHRLLTDNGKEVGRKFTQECQRLGIKHKKTKIKHPWTNGQVETTIKQIKADTIWKIYYQNDEELKKALIAWQNTYNLKDKLRSIKGLTPYQKVVEYYQETKQDGKERQIFVKKPTKEKLRICTITL